MPGDNGFNETAVIMQVLGHSKGEQDTGDQTDSYGLEQTSPVDTWSCFCFLFRVSPNLDGSDLSTVGVGSERHLRIPVYILLSKFVFLRSEKALFPKLRISVSSRETFVFPGERQSSEDHWLSNLLSAAL